MTETTYYAAAAVTALLAVVVGWWVGQPKGKGGLGMALGFLLSWVGVLIVSMIKGTPSADPEERADARTRGVVGVVLGIAGVAAAGGLLFLGAQVKEPISDTVGRMTGHAGVSCDLEGWLLVGGQRSDVYGCSTSEVAGGGIGCYAKVGDYVQNVTDQAVALANLGGAKLPCAST